MENVTKAEDLWFGREKHAKSIQTDHERAENQTCCDIIDENRHEKNFKTFFAMEIFRAKLHGARN